MSPRLAFCFIGSVALGLALPVPLGPAWAQSGEDDRAIDIDVGSSRIGGPGLTEGERAAVAAMDAEEEYVTEETVPPKGSKKRLPALHTLAKRYHDSQQWKEACTKYDVILEEAGVEGLDADPSGRKQAFRSYLECGDAAFAASEFDKAEASLKKSEQYGPSDHRHLTIRRKILKEQYHKKLSSGDLDGAIGLFNQYQTTKADEDERIWFGEQIAALAWTAYKEKNKTELAFLIERGTAIAPMNSELRQLKEKIEQEGAVLGNVALLGAVALVAVASLTALSRWRAKKKMESLAGGGLAEPDLDSEP